jgi:hypothetical protein
MTTARDIIEAALRKIHVVGVGQSLSGSEAVDALQTLNAMLDSWSVQGNLVFAETIETFNLTGAASYTIGSGATFNTSRPVDIASAYVSSGDTDYPLDNYDWSQYSNITDKSASGIPSIFYYNAGFPTATIYLYPVPSGVSTITLHSFKPLSSIANLNAEVVLPPSYERAMVYNLAVEIAPEYEKEASPSVKAIANESKKAVMTANIRNANNISYVDAGLLSNKGKFDIYRGY